MRQIYVLCVLCLILVAEPIAAKDGSLGVSLAKELYIDDSQFGGEFGQLAIQVFVAYKLAANLSVQIAYERDLQSSSADPIDQGLAAGALYLIRPLHEIQPYLRAEILVGLDPELTLGTRFGPGVRIELFRLIGLEDGFISLQVPLKMVFEKSDESYYSIELPRLGFEYDF
jgi:hypothetical protein